MPGYTISDFFDVNSNVVPISGEDFYVNGTNLFFATSSTALNSITAVIAVGNNLSSLYLSEFDSLSSIQINEPNLQIFTSNTHLNFISAVNVGVQNLVVSGSNFGCFQIFYSPNIRTIDIRNCSNTPYYAFFGNISLSSIYVSRYTFNTTNIFTIYDGNLTSENLDTILNTICSSRIESNLSQMQISINNNQLNTTVSAPATASLVERGAAVSISS